MNKILFTILILLFLLGVSLFGIWYLNESMLVDLDHGFIFTDIKGWKVISPKEGAYRSLVTLKDDVIISYADIRFIKKEKVLNEVTMVRIAKEECQNIVNEPNITSKDVEITEFQKDKSPVVVCRAEGFGVVNKLPTVVTMYSFFGLKNNVLIITTSYPKGDGFEETKTEKLIQRLRFF